VVKAVSKGARIEDMLQLAVGNDPPMMNGPMQLNANLEIPAGPQDYLDRMKLKGDFEVDPLHFSNPDIEKKVATFSNRAQGNPQSDSESTPATLKGAFDMDDGIITFSKLHFEVTGASVDLAGNYGMDNGALDFQGALRMDAKLSQTMTGVKSFFLKAVDPFFSKKGAGTYVPIKITGTKDHPIYGLNFHHKDKTEKTEGSARGDVPALRNHCLAYCGCCWVGCGIGWPGLDPDPRRRILLIGRLGGFRLRLWRRCCFRSRTHRRRIPPRSGRGRHRAP
jgi:hypothetical protein